MSHVAMRITYSSQPKYTSLTIDLNMRYLFLLHFLLKKDSFTQSCYYHGGYVIKITETTIVMLCFYLKASQRYRHLSQGILHGRSRVPGGCSCTPPCRNSVSADCRTPGLACQLSCSRIVSTTLHRMKTSFETVPS